MNNIVILSAGKTLNDDLYPFFKDKKKNKLITNYRQKTLDEFNLIVEILGYSKKKIFQKSKFFINNNWKKEKSCGSFLKYVKNFEDKNLFVSYSDIIFNKSAVSNILKKKADISFHINFLDYNKKKIKEKITINKKKFEFSGLVYFDKKVISFLNKNSKKLYRTFYNKNLSSLILYLIKKFNYNYFLDGNVKECNVYSDYLNFLFFTKGHALSNFSFKEIKINKFVNFTFNEWKHNKSIILQDIQNKLKKKLIVRSSSSMEDNLHFSNAGKYLSIPNISNTKNNLSKSIKKVFNTYDNLNLDDFIIVQDMQLNYHSSGVIFSRDIENSSPYYVINQIEKKHGDTSSVTSGISSKEKKTIILKSSKIIPSNFLKLVKFLKYVENITGIKNLDCEFAMTKKETVIFQIRPLVLNKVIPDKKIFKKINNENKLLKNFKKKNKLLFSVMTDWNPAEIIGKNSFPLSIFIYEYLILNSNWYYQRFQNGYSKIIKKKLSYKIGNTLYIDVIKSFQSFIPNNISKNLKNKLLDKYFSKLTSKSNLHDKVESKIVISNLSPRFYKKVKEYKLSFKDEKILENQLRKINSKIINLVKKNFHSLEKLNKESLSLYNKFCKRDNVKDIYKILKETKNHFILPFAHLARGAFVSKYILEDIFVSTKVNKILSNIETVSSKLKDDHKKLSKVQFKKKYLHLVPNTYNFENVLNKENLFKNIKEKTHNEKKLDISKFFYRKFLQKKIINLGFKDVEEFIDFINYSISGREYAKFIFTRNIYLIFSIFKNWGVKKNIKLHHINFIDKKIFNTLNQGFKRNIFNKDIESKISDYKINSLLNLPDIIFSPENLFYFNEINSQPTFIGKNITSKVIKYSSSKLKSKIYKNKIVLIENADPGFEFLFHLGIKGIITKYGGSNSHMAIRSNELGLTSIIGAGNKFKNLKSINKIKIDTLKKNYKIIS